MGGSKVFFLFLTMVASAWAGDHRGSGGDLVKCERSPENKFEGFYSLDYLATYSSTAVDVALSDTYQEQLSRLVKTLKTKLPVLGASLEIFVADYKNIKDPSRRYYWEEAPYGFKDIMDENLVNEVPDNCQKDGAVLLQQAVIHQDAAQSGVRPGTTVLKFNPKLVNPLEKAAVLQLSYLLVHEWLWDFSTNVERNRRINRFLHSAELESLTPEVAAQRLRSFGLDPEHPLISDEPPPIPTAVMICKTAVGVRDIIERTFVPYCQKKGCVEECASDQYTVEARHQAAGSHPEHSGKSAIVCLCRVPGMGKGNWTCHGTETINHSPYTGVGDSRYAAEMDVLRQCRFRKYCDIEKCSRRD